jgi:sialate O-acetylesterase
MDGQSLPAQSRRPIRDDHRRQERRRDAPIVVKDVLVGEVWLGSGQSNMQFYVSKNGPGHAPYGLLDEEKEIAAANYPQLRMFTVKNASSYTPQTDEVGTWQVCTPETVPNFSAVGYLFGRDLNQALKLPVGIVLSAFGASTAEAWIPRDTLAADPQLKPMLDKLDAREDYFKAHSRQLAPMPTPAPLPAHHQRSRAAPRPHARSRARSAPANRPVQLHDQPHHSLCHPRRHLVSGRVHHRRRCRRPALRPRHGDDGHRLAQALGRRQLPLLRRPAPRPAERQQQPARPRAAGQDPLAAQLRHGRRPRHQRGAQRPSRTTRSRSATRLTEIALANVYGKKIEFSGPVYSSMKVEGNAIRITFTHAAGLMAKGDKLNWFQIAGADQKFVDADAKIEGSSVIVSSPSVTAPVAVRYAWDNYPDTANLYNSAGLQAAPFRTDTWDAMPSIEAQFTAK